jgi:hypothetical protein
MAGHARLDAEGALHHIIVRGIERRLIFRDDIERGPLPAFLWLFSPFNVVEE